jgi:hypothetical protein
MTSTRLTLTAALLLLLLCAAATVRANDGTTQDVLRLDVVPARPFAQGTKTLQFEGSYTTAIRYSQNEFTTGSVGVGYYLWDNHSVTLLAQGFHVNQEPGESTDGGAVFVLGRSHLYNTGRLSFYVDGGGGYAWANDAVPVGGTTYNFTARVGAGVAYRLYDDCYLTAGARYFHLSNAKQHGREKNPSYDGMEYYVGLLFAFR